MQVSYWGRLIPESGKVHQNQEVYNTVGWCPTLKATHYKDPPKILVRGKHHELYNARNQF